jgi:paraquat-inducible protein A
MNPQSLNSRFPGNFQLPALVLASAACLVFGLSLPVLTFKEMVFWKHTFSVLTGIQSLYQERSYGLAAIIFLFSVIFPIVKLSMLLVIWYWPFSERKRSRIVAWVTQLGKWSMLDVFVVAITIVIAKLSKAMAAEPRPGIYVFALSVLLAMIAAWRVEALAKRRNTPSP